MRRWRARGSPARDCGRTQRLCRLRPPLLPPAKFEPVGLSFVGASLASPGAMEALEHTLAKNHPLRALFLADRPGAGAAPAWTYNLLLKHGVRSALEYARSFDLARAHAASNPSLSPHVEFVDLGGHGYATVRLTGTEMRTEFVCIPRPVTRKIGRAHV